MTKLTDDKKKKKRLITTQTVYMTIQDTQEDKTNLTLQVKNWYRAFNYVFYYLNK